jgi:hypothetical protein
MNIKHGMLELIRNDSCTVGGIKIASSSVLPKTSPFTINLKSPFFITSDFLPIPSSNIITNSENRESASELGPHICDLSISRKIAQISRESSTKIWNIRGQPELLFGLIVSQSYACFLRNFGLE